MNIALIYRGFYKRDFSRINRRNKVIRKSNNFTEEIFKNNIASIKTLDIKKIDIYFHTYSVNDEEDKKMLSIFKEYSIKKYMFEKDIKKKISYSIIESLKLVDNDDDYDLIINTRFDIYFIKPLNNFSIKKNKLNLCFKDSVNAWYIEKSVSDLMYIFPPKYKDKLIFSLNRTRGLSLGGSGHKIYKYLKINKEEELNFMIPGHYISNTDDGKNGYFYLKRD